MPEETILADYDATLLVSPSLDPNASVSLALNQTTGTFNPTQGIVSGFGLALANNIQIGVSLHSKLVLSPPQAMGANTITAVEFIPGTGTTSFQGTVERMLLVTRYGG